MTDSFYVPDGDRFVATELSRGPWDPGAQHGGPPSALIARALERCEPRDDMRIARITIEILRAVPLSAFTLDARVVRPGRSVELLEATMSDERGPVVTARAWRLATGRTTADPADAPPPVEDARVESFFDTGHDVGYHTAMDVRFTAGAFLEPGPAAAWMRMRVPLLPDEEPTGLQRVMAAADTGNGLSARLDTTTHLFINTDLTVHLLAEPIGEWIHLDAVTRFGPDGIGLAETRLSDARGPIGRGTQTLLVRAR